MFKWLIRKLDIIYDLILEDIKPVYNQFIIANYSILIMVLKKLSGYNVVVWFYYNYVVIM